ncbi:DNA repair endonuclease XPF-like isoform X2 [Dysidea avara]|uniref:DNA repair endonuclease XPF-like isoform X2 n=1 Tax=Dysidea avara TaxID=196820 RepID=UPI00331E16AA
MSDYRGLGLDQLMIKFLELYSDPKVLVLALNTKSTEEMYFIDELQCRGVTYLPKVITNEYTAKEREAIYLKGGVLFITSRIIVMDLLKKICPVEKVLGILVYKAHKVTDESSLAFILRLYRQDNKAGFVKAFSDSPDQCSGRYSHLDRMMRNMFLKNLYVWPRFHATVVSSLAVHKPEVVEMRQPMSPNMVSIQMAILDITKACLEELQQANPSLDMEELNLENSLQKSFAHSIKMQLDPVWNQLGAKTKQLVSDLHSLRNLLYNLTQYDCVTFYHQLELLRYSSDGHGKSSWMFMDAANTLFAKAGERVYGKQSKIQGHKQNDDQLIASDGREIFPEEPPKWKVLSQVIEEVSNAAKEAGSKILVAANDERTCYQLREYLCVGGSKLLLRVYEKLVATTVKKGSERAPPLPKNKAQKTRRRGKHKASPSGGGEASSIAKKVKVDHKEGNEDGTSSDHSQESLEEHFRQESLKLDDELATIDQDHFGLLPDPLVVVHAMSSSEDPYHLTRLIKELSPKYIVMYDPSIEFVRQVEIYKASNPENFLRVYFIFYESSVEEQRYLTALRKEKEAFQHLIKQKAHMVVPEEREGKQTEASGILTRDSRLAKEDAISSRKGGQHQKEKHQVIVDMREFRSALPSLLHKRGIDIIPVTLEIGDYILSPEMCVERKSVSDLIGSLNSGRLYNQATMMTRYYKRPILLIEFTESRSFSLQSKASLTSDISINNVSSKLALLTLHFPKLRILWCSSPHATAELFEELKCGSPQPTMESAIAVTTSEELRNDDNTIVYNSAAEDFVLKLPGINSKNYRYLLNQVKDMQELVSLSQDKLEEILGSDSNAHLLWQFLHSNLQS